MANSSGMYRVKPAILGGVCAGIASKVAIDVGVVRLLCVVLTFLSAGFVGLIYLLLWVLLPKSSVEVTSAVDVEVRDLDSDTYGRVARTMFRQDDGPLPPPNVVSAGELAPTPPLAYQGITPSEHVVSHASASIFDEHGGAFVQPKRSVLRSRTSVRTGFVLLIFIVTYIFGLALHTLFVEDDPFRLWPLVLVALGIARLMLPSAHEFEAGALLVGFVLFGFGMVLLLHSLGVITIQIGWWVSDCWPLVLIGFGLACLGFASRSTNLIALAGFLFALTMFVCITAYAPELPAMPEWVDLDPPAGEMEPAPRDSAAAQVVMPGLQEVA